MCRTLDSLDKISSSHATYSLLTKPPSLTDLDISLPDPVAQYTFHPEPLVDLKLSNKIGFSKFPVFLIESPFHQPLTVKLYPLNKSQINLSYLNEKRFFTLSHPNIVNMLGTVDNQCFKLSDESNEILEASCIAMEYAPYGDFCDILSTYAVFNDDVLVRTFFHHLIEAMKHLHERKISHLDIKLDNLLLGEDFNLKLTDFDLSHVEGDANMMGRGTLNYRAPEIQNSTCLNPNSADIYSAGIVLYMLKTGKFPFVENGDNTQTIEQKNNKLVDFGEGKDEAIKCDVDFKKLFSEMINSDPNVRKSIKDIEENKWYKGDIYETKMIPGVLNRLFMG